MDEIAQAWTEPRRAIITGDGWKYMTSPRRDEQMMFDLSADPGETENRFGRRGIWDVTERLHDRLVTSSCETDDHEPIRSEVPRQYQAGFLSRRPDRMQPLESNPETDQ